MNGTVLVGDDHTLGGVLASVAEDLARRGYSVRRLAAEPAPRRTVVTPAQWLRDHGDVDVAVISSRTALGPDVLAVAERLRGIVFGSIGTNGCDLDAATARSIAVANGATTENVDSLAEANVMLMVALLARLQVKTAEFGSRPKASTAVSRSRMLRDKTVGFIGYGRIAQATEQRLAGWGVGRVLAHTRTPAPRRFPDVRFVDLPTLLAEADVIAINAPLNASTANLVDRDMLRRTKPGAVVVNTARGGIVDEDALAELLRAGHLGGVALDTFRAEPPSAEHPLTRCDNAIVTNHNVGHTRELFDSLVPTAIGNVADLLAGRVPAHLANPAVTTSWLRRWAQPIPSLP
ncbi:D-isomer specific 2-hydroxyacid dehydrogenase NAD-binding protein OS=Tsukamurella paurometabola (strain ATCC 8368 / DSM / CCUG 35730 / CIP 100753 / JCM 10117 / KCTC 9821 / NBRC 16120 / NCIMB 702349 / NCTC 13040)OX=521096 GN=Tpau_1543 PE=3 SV=1 [Tsukamurella paurometabola]|uniref:D-isomer specific 2-hydroxyacid dehydrogenase NAD-binding protein n=1 Tax=Tsukamurella paurometabola (strain ATCC 8368 / DSM 20162 / CCUG 35730 / CIP 100753 / JCM 10117 / KCTC 9821 / NBRC 16120 / NCIMB 702349 / NCTC 13040) TaxID=521096 RepID=D5UY58_TSUPD|nr:2-hydroxyacid dehydrogenase [Tsukamurella paurometabola]ADG78165.1 D-isomer specific 2-hydroxyacid dehydrogenase NAD-binding protein [Tsukamurella paurometabola DSM 20162]SUP30493.1 D-3-phosphoglycerate dehydrogenase [Tsukamurella paurometabola]